MFGAFTANERRRYWPWALAITALFALAVTFAVRRDPSTHTVITPHGIKTVRMEMTQSQVTSVLGKPIAALESDGCFHYGYPKMDADFDVYRVCYADGRVREFKTERFEVRRILGEDEELTVPEPPAPREPNLVDLLGLPPAQLEKMKAASSSKP